MSSRRMGEHVHSARFLRRAVGVALLSLCETLRMPALCRLGSPSPRRTRRGLVFTLGLLLLGVLLPLFTPNGVAAERVVLVRPRGEAELERLDHIEEVLAEAILGAGHSAITELVPTDPDAPPPQTANELRAVAELQSAAYVVIPEVTAALHDSYRLSLRVGFAPDTRSEQVEVLVWNENELDRLTDVFQALLRPEGIGDDVLRLTEDPPRPGTPPPDEAAEQAEEESTEAQEQFVEREAERAAQAQEDAQASWEARERYGQSAPWMLSAGLDFRPLALVPDGRTGGLLGSLSLRVGRSFEGVDGFEVRGVVDLTTGAQSGFSVGAGAAYLYSPFEDLPIHFGVSLELGLAQALTGNRVPSFFLRLAPTAAWRMVDELYLEAALAEVQYLSAGGGVMTLGFSARVAFRF